MCILRVSGKAFDADKYLALSGLVALKVFRVGEPRLESRPNGKRNETSGFTVDVSSGSWENLQDQVTDAIDFLQDHELGLKVLRSAPGVEDMRLDFPIDLSIDRRKIMAQFDFFPPELVHRAGALGLGLEISIYPVDFEELAVNSMLSAEQNETQRAIEFHDSTLVAIAHEGNSLCLTIDAYVHCWERVAGIWKGTGWMQAVRISMAGASCTMQLELPSELYGGEIRAKEKTYVNMVSLPFALSEPVRLLLELDSGEMLEITGQGISMESMGASRYVEELPEEFKSAAERDSIASELGAPEAKATGDTGDSMDGVIENLGTSRDEDAFHSLIELGPEVVPVLISAFKNEQRATTRMRLIEVVSQFRDPAVCEFLAGTLDDSDASIWKASLDALVSLGGPAARAVLGRALEKEMTRGSRDKDRLDWITEAHQQLGERPK